MITEHTKSTSLALAALLLGAYSVAAATRYVSPAGRGGAPFNTPATAGADIQQVVDSAADGDTILIAAGHYVPGEEIVVEKALTLQGQGRPEAVVIDGGGTNRCIRITAAGVSLENLTVANGRELEGGGIKATDCTIRNCVIRDCTAIGAAGGGIHVTGTLTMMDTTVINNTAQSGAGIKVIQSLVMNSCTITGNVARVDGGAIDGGRRVTITGSTITSNQAGRNGGAIDCSHRAVVEITDSVLNDNTSTDTAHGHGGAIDVKGSTRALLTRCTLKRNSAGRRGGAVNNWGEATLTDCTVADNTAQKGADVFTASSRARTRQLTAQDTISNN